MAVSFQSSQRRAFWTAIFLSFATDYLIVLVVLSVLGIREGNFLWALLWALGIETLVALYALLGVGKRIAWYYLFERERRVSATAADIVRHQLPAPEPYYNDAEDYLYKAAMAPNTPVNGRLFAGMILGALAVQRTVGPRVEAFLTSITVEAALQRLEPQKAYDPTDDGGGETSFDLGVGGDSPTRQG